MASHAVIVGGGIAGLTTALCFVRIGWRVTVLEQAPEISEVGAGLQISPNGMKVLRALGLERDLRGVAFEPDAIEMRMGRSGRKVFEIPLKAVAETRWDAPYLHVHRADLIGVLLKTLVAAQPDAIRTGVVVSSYSGNSVMLKGGEGVTGDLIVGADGVHSVIRESMMGPDRAKFGQCAAWRMTVPIERLGDLAPPPTACIWAGPGRHAVTYRIRGGKLVNFVGLVETDDWTSEGWMEQGAKEDTLSDFAGWDPVLTRIIEAADAYFRWALFERAPLTKWSDGEAVVIGDAAHPMMPTLAQGAVMGMEDAWVLASLLAGGAKVQDAGTALYQARIERVSKVQAKAWANVRNFHHRGAMMQTAHYGPMWLAGQIAPSFVSGLQDWLYGYDVTQAFSA